MAKLNFHQLWDAANTFRHNMQLRKDTQYNNVTTQAIVTLFHISLLLAES